MKCTWFCIGVIFMTLVRENLSASRFLSDQSGYYMPTLPPRTGSSTKRSFTCACDASPQEPLCASNGITYKTQCNFDCAKNKVPRLRVVQTGACGSLNRNQFWNGSKGGKKLF